MSTANTESAIGATSKIERYKWTVKDKQGVLLDIGKHELHIDRSYQRDANERKVLALAAKWSWVACGVITVADRDGTFWVIDGQHRVMAARKRADIDKLPCIVFESLTSKDEARGFLDANTQRKPITGFDRFRADLVTGDPGAILINRLCAATGRELNADPGPNHVRCVSTMRKHAANAPDVLESLWPLIHELFANQSVQEKLLDGLMYIEQHLPDGESLTDRRWKERVLRIGMTKLMDGAQQASAYYKRGGSRVWALGIVQALNYKHRIELKLAGTDTDDT